MIFVTNTTFLEQNENATNYVLDLFYQVRNLRNLFESTKHIILVSIAEPYTLVHSEKVELCSSPYNIFKIWFWKKK